MHKEKYPRKRGLQGVDTKTPRKYLLLMARENNIQEFTTIWNEKSACIYR